MSEQAEQIQARAILRGYRATPRKARQVVDLIRGKGVEEARAILKFTAARRPDGRASSFRRGERGLKGDAGPPNGCGSFARRLIRGERSR